MVQSDEIPPELTGLLDNASFSLVHEPLPELEFLSTPTGDEERLRNGSVDAVLRLRMNDTVLNTLSSTSPRPSKKFAARSRTFEVLGAWEENETERRIDAPGFGC